MDWFMSAAIATATTALAVAIMGMNQWQTQLRKPTHAEVGIVLCLLAGIWIATFRIFLIK